MERWALRSAANVPVAIGGCCLGREARAPRRPVVSGGPDLPLRRLSVAYSPPNTEHDVTNTGAVPLRYVYVVARAIPQAGRARGRCARSGRMSSFARPDVRRHLQEEHR